MTGTARWASNRRREKRQQLVIAGAGGFSREAAETIAAVNAQRPTWDLLGFVDDNLELAGTSIGHLDVIGPIGLLHSELRGAKVVVCTGRADNYFSRPRIVQRLNLPPNRYATVVHPTASVAASAHIGHGTVMLASTVVTANARIGHHVAIMPDTVITHDDVIEDFATLASGVKLGGSVRVGRGTYVGAGALVREGVSIGDWSLVGMGSVITRSVPAAELWYGAPARRQRLVAVPDDVTAPLRVSDPGLEALVLPEGERWAEAVAETRT
jgi:sugar O-acyltransferase (sialic acid O-acetyltransferase NeuD family)